MSWRTLALGLMAFGVWAITATGCLGSAAPTPTPTPTAVEGWTGVVETAAPGGKFATYFRRDNGESYGITGRDENLTRQLELLRNTGRLLRINGQLPSVADVASRQIVVTRLETVSTG